MSKYGYLEVFSRVPSISITRVDCTFMATFAIQPLQHLKKVFKQSAPAKIYKPVSQGKRLMVAQTTMATKNSAGHQKISVGRPCGDSKKFFMLAIIAYNSYKSSVDTGC